MRIPVRFKMFGQTIEVVPDSTLRTGRHSAGEARYNTNEIALDPSSEEHGIPRDQIEHSFCHELVHFLFYYGGSDQISPPLHDREYLVDRLGGLLHQVLDTMEFEEESSRNP